jgi:hypothetical protein
MAKSLGNELRLRRIASTEPEPGKTLGLVMCVCGVCSIIPILGLIAGLGHLILWILYWSKMAAYSRTLDLTPVTLAPGPPTLIV